MMSVLASRPRADRRGSSLRALAFGFGAFLLLAAVARLAPAGWFAVDGPVVGHPYVVDGDSLRFGARDVRLKGIDAPELDQTCRLADQPAPCGRAARAELVRIIGGRSVTCLPEGRDRFGRLLARCLAGAEPLNARMVENGHAVAFGDYLVEEARARAAGRGVWATTFDPPKVWRERSRQGS